MRKKRKPTTTRRTNETVKCQAVNGDDIIDIGAARRSRTTCSKYITSDNGAAIPTVNLQRHALADENIRSSVRYRASQRPRATERVNRAPVKALQVATVYLTAAKNARRDAKRQHIRASAGVFGHGRWFPWLHSDEFRNFSDEKLPRSRGRGGRETATRVPTIPVTKTARTVKVIGRGGDICAT